MAVVEEIVKKKKGYQLHVVPTEKYKTNTLVWKMKAPLDEETVTFRAILPYLLQSSSKQFPTTTKLRSYLDDLYGANFFVDVGKKGENHIISFSVEVANEKFLKNSEPLLEKGITFLNEILFNPNVEQGKFHEETVTSEKRNLKQRLQSVFDDKMRYAGVRLVEEMCETEPFSLQPNGIKEKVDDLTAKSIYQYYEKALKEDELDFYIIGDVDPTEVENICDRLFSLQDRKPKEITMKHEVKSTVKEIKEKQEVNQGKLNIGFRTGTTYRDQDYFALQVFNGIFGGFSHSKLFLNVREKMSLAYYAASRLESHKGLLLVMSGIDSKNYEQALTIIKEQMEAMKKGDFTDKEIEQTKAVICNQLLETIDTSRGLVEVLYHNVIAKQTISIDDWLDRVKQTTKQEILDIAQKVQLDTIYFLTGMEGA
ncbi:putative Zn-dependent peptidase [Oikeobacillus pervagus]|uniref:Zn-dependent peptidase n=1 Tax=Oikeobacillus pervagus TaxID=1325931 RepID=A0AAJ1SZP4_9BACI|nr:pitrilysin family protein [Oikeobacillus pervagus]MDQ0214222.1 putative Zn-dependent peptidase [Oikeobacillus pervagus]